MNVLIAFDGTVPVSLYGGTERVIWSLGKELGGMGHNVSYLVRKGSSSPFARIVEYDPDRDIYEQIPPEIDIIHFNRTVMMPEDFRLPYVVTIHSNENVDRAGYNAIFVSRSHAENYGNTAFVYNGLDWNDYPAPDLDKSRDRFHFLGNAAWRLKNVKGAISVAKKIKNGRLEVLGGHKFNVRMGFRFTLSPRIGFHGMVDNAEKGRLIERSRGLIFPIRWHEPFGLAMTESLYFGAPVFGTPYGSLPELITPEVGYLSASSDDMARHINDNYDYSVRRCHEYAADLYNSHIMAENYLKMYEKVLSGGKLNDAIPSLKPSPKFLPWE